MNVGRSFDATIARDSNNNNNNNYYYNYELRIITDTRTLANGMFGQTRTGFVQSDDSAVEKRRRSRTVVVVDRSCRDGDLRDRGSSDRYRATELRIDGSLVWRTILTAVKRDRRNPKTVRRTFETRDGTEMSGIPPGGCWKIGMSF